jgi:hypothetical protein
VLLGREVYPGGLAAPSAREALLSCGDESRSRLSECDHQRCTALRPKCRVSLPFALPKQTAFVTPMQISMA